MGKIRDHELDKYAQCWGMEEYLTKSPGEVWSDLFGEIASPEAGQSAIDIGCGAGAGGKALSTKYGLNVTYLDFDNFANLKPFKAQPLWKPIIKPQGGFDFGYCCDVMEHIPEEFTMLCASNALQTCDHVFFSISFLPDHFGQFIGEPLHLTVKPFVWWRDRLREIGDVMEARDFIVEGIFYVRQ